MHIVFVYYKHISFSTLYLYLSEEQQLLFSCKIILTRFDSDILLSILYVGKYYIYQFMVN